MSPVLQPIFLVLAGVFGCGVFLLVLGQPLGRPRPDLLARVRELDPQYWPNRLETPVAAEAPEWLGIPVLDALVRPLLEASASRIGRAIAYIGLADPREIERANSKLEARFQRAPTDEEMAGELQMSIEDFQEALLQISN